MNNEIKKETTKTKSTADKWFRRALCGVDANTLALSMHKAFLIAGLAFYGVVAFGCMLGMMFAPSPALLVWYAVGLVGNALVAFEYASKLEKL